jgi:nitroimidazol reductase NimA-like FMN-containing flavoprotein (pyridoxamine 5'-phosphate oxidase superfamily)
MALDQQTAMDEAATDAVLARHETGVLSLARDDNPYAIPISYGYDATDRRVLMRLVSTPDSDKPAFFSSSPSAKLVVYEESEEVYRSVIVTGRLEEITPDELNVEHVEQYGDTKRPLFEVWGQSKEDLDIRLYELQPAEISGRKIELDPERYE